MRNEGLSSNENITVRGTGTSVHGCGYGCNITDGIDQNPSSRFDSVDRALLDGTARLARNVLDLEQVAAKLFGYDPQLGGADGALCVGEKPSFIESANGHVDHLAAFNKRLESVINAFNS